MFCCCRRHHFETKGSLTKEKKSDPLPRFNDISEKSTEISMDKSQQERPHNTAYVECTAVIQGERRLDQASDTEDKVSLLDNDSMGKQDPSNDLTSENASDGICFKGRSNLSYEDTSPVLPHTGSPITFPDKGKDTWEAQAKKLNDTEDKVSLLDNDSMGKQDPSNDLTSENASDGICFKGRSNLSYEDTSPVLPHTGSPITFPDKGKDTWEAQAKKLNDTEDKVSLLDNDSMGKDPSHGLTSENASDGRCSKGRRNLSNEDTSSVLPHTGSPITFSDKGKDTWEAQAKKLKEKLDLLEKKRNDEKRKYEEDLKRNREQIKQLEESISELLNRLSSQAAARMTHNNPYITDLSDQNRPTKISERYSELYDNQWTDAFELLHTNHHLSKKKAIQVLRRVLYVSFHKCKEARKLGEGLLKALKEYIGEDEECDDVTILEVMRTLKGTKRNIKKMQENFNQLVRLKLAEETNYEEMLPDIRPYIDECVEICLLMNIQEPPVELRGLEQSSGSAFDLSAFQSYTKSGNIIKYIVWPAMYLYQNGPLLRKGVAQGMRDSSTGTETGANKDDFTTEVVEKMQITRL